MSERVTLCRLEDIAPGSAKRFEVGKHRVAVVRCDNEVYAVGDTCTHADFSLSEGEVYCDEREIECWKHGSTFSLITGEPQSLPATRPVPVYKAELEGDDIVVTLP
ncbi:MAG: 3-phenylpropionate/trans-cinnamate dioxygenase ferredoxin component [Acidimicrobiaceae bacterium]|jgi:3-phenylpropionate/trans-cinnamate dioxygenase ferredoxin subunit